MRPVSNHDEGALDFAERRLADSIDPKPLDVVRLALLPREFEAPFQPENLPVQPGPVWVKEFVVDIGMLSGLVEEPGDLWRDSVQKSDRASESALRKLENFQSLYLIRPDNFHFQIRSRIWEGYPKKQQRGIFSYRGVRYDFALTDPLISQKYFRDYPRMPDGEIQPSHPEGILLCVSLTPPFHELHYKVIATVFELPR